MAKQFVVSRAALVMRLSKLQLIDDHAKNQAMAILMQNQTPKQTVKDNNKHTHKNIVRKSELGTAFIDVVLNAYDAGLVPTTKVARILGVRNYYRFDELRVSQNV